MGIIYDLFAMQNIAGVFLFSYIFVVWTIFVGMLLFYICMHIAHVKHTYMHNQTNY